MNYKDCIEGVSTAFTVAAAVLEIAFLIMLIISPEPDTD